MPAITPSFVMDLESRMRMIQDNEYLRLSSNLWWSRLTRTFTSQSRRDIINWVISSAQIDDMGQGGNIEFDPMYLMENEYTHGEAGKGLKLRRKQFEDLDGNGVQLATEWAAQMGAQSAYWPQKRATQLLKDGTTRKGYDGKAFFATDHPVNPKKPSAGVYSNLLNGSGYKIDVSVTADVALANLAKVFAAITAIKMPNGVDPRFLRPEMILCGPTLFPRAVQITNAKFLAQAAASGGGGADVEALISALGYGMPQMADELAGYESDTTYFVACKQLTQSQIGGLLYIEREGFSTRYYTGRGGGTGVDAILDRADELEWHHSGRNGSDYGHPYTIIKVSPST